MQRYVCRHGLIAWRQAGSISGDVVVPPAPTGSMKRQPAQVRTRGMGRARTFGSGVSASSGASLTLTGANCTQANTSGTGAIWIGVAVLGSLVGSRRKTMATRTNKQTATR